MGALAVYFPYLGSVPSSDFHLGQQTQQGLTLDGLEKLKQAGFTSSEISDVIIPARTLKHRRAKQQRLSPEESERLLRVVRVLAFADRVFGEHEKAMRWLRRPSSRLEDTSPLSNLRTEAGTRFVEGMLWSISENLYQ
ncbi:antitoxin Xre-like helix-turn-helix domain-containing protein [Terriglobus sp.]|uniref:antitoxin Xre-like helix-turn-helix domain-containing protein n=1 Tax=Terriglobus sp. TaxID=1889013 RepID=UPI003B00C304